MTVQNVIDLAVTGELRNLAVSKEPESILSYLNLGLIELYKRFPLNVEEAIITLRDDKEIYMLDGTDPDVSMDVTKDYMWVVAAYGEVDEHSSQAVNILPINEEDNPLSINTVSWNKVQIPLTVEGGFISLMYVTAPRYLTLADLDTAIAIPPQMLEALLHYIGYRAHGAVDGNIQSENSTHYQRFELSCKQIETRGMLTSDDLNMVNKFKNRIWA